MMQSWARSGVVTNQEQVPVSDEYPSWEPAVDDTLSTPIPGEEPSAGHELAAPAPPIASPPPARPWLWAALLGALVGALVAGGLVAAFGGKTTTRSATNFGPN